MSVICSVLFSVSFEVIRCESPDHEAHRSRLAILVTWSSLPFSSWLGHAESLAIRNCTWCHGVSAQGYNPAPGLAGQRREYIQSQLKKFQRTHARQSIFTTIHVGCHSKSQPSDGARFGGLFFDTILLKRPMMDIGSWKRKAKTIYQLGMPDSNTAACVVCHGPNAEGVGEIPRLGGLAYTYLKRRLEQWGQGYHGTAKPPMPGIASKLSANQIEALASYLSFVK